MKLCPYCSKEMELAALVCPHCERDWKTGVSHREVDVSDSKADVSHLETDGPHDDAPDVHSSAANAHRAGVAYVVTTATLIAAITASGWCWSSQNVASHPSMPLRDVCLTIWVVAGILLALSQIIFIGIGLRINDSAITTTDGGTGMIRESRASVPRVVILVGSFVILITIAVFVFALSQMPS
jgi:hypothetical protein